MDRTSLQQEIRRPESQTRVLRTERGRVQQEREHLSELSLTDRERQAREEQRGEEMRSLQAQQGAIQQELAMRRAELRALEAATEKDRQTGEFFEKEAIQKEEYQKAEAVEKERQTEELFEKQERERQESLDKQELQLREAEAAEKEHQTKENVISEITKDVAYSAGQTIEAWREVKESLEKEIEGIRPEPEAELAMFEQEREALLAKFGEERKQLSETQEKARKDVLDTMNKAGFSPEAVDRGLQIQEQVFNEQREQQERVEQARLHQLAREYRVKESERYKEIWDLNRDDRRHQHTNIVVGDIVHFRHCLGVAKAEAGHLHRFLLLCGEPHSSDRCPTASPQAELRSMLIN
jgi:hypothetical protein